MFAEFDFYLNFPLVLSSFFILIKFIHAPNAHVDMNGASGFSVIFLFAV